MASLPLPYPPSKRKAIHLAAVFAMEGPFRRSYLNIEFTEELEILGYKIVLIIPKATFTAWHGPRQKMSVGSESLENDHYQANHTKSACRR
jgi:hypothetical protein